MTRAAQRSLLTNAASLVGTSALTSGLGFAFWWVAARLLPAEMVGTGTALVSAMTLLGTLAMWGLGTLLIQILPSASGRAPGLISASLLLTAGLGLAFGLLGGALLPGAFPNFGWLRSGGAPLLVFALGVALTSTTLVFDQAMIGVLRGGLQLGRNVVAAALKIVTLGWLSGFMMGALVIYMAWLLSNLVSLLIVGGVTQQQRLVGPPDWSGLRPLLRPALRHHALNLSLQAPSLIIPVLVASQVSPTQNAQFYLAWMVAGFLTMIPYALSTVLPALKTHDAAVQAHRVQQSVQWSFMACVLGSALLVVLASPLLHLFGPAYDGAQISLQVLAMTSLPVVVKAHYIALGRLRDRLLPVSLAVGISGMLEVLGVAAGLRLGGVTGAAAGLLLALMVEATGMGKTVWRSTWGAGPAATEVRATKP